MQFIRLSSSANQRPRPCAVSAEPSKKGNYMKYSTQRILTTHVGSLARPDALSPLLRLKEQNQSYDREELGRQVHEAVAFVVRKQGEAGVDIVTDGEQGKSGFFTYVVERLDRKSVGYGKRVDIGGRRI